jgi:transposase
MALGRQWRERQEEFWVPRGELPKSAGHPFYCKLNELLHQADFDEFVEDLCGPYYAEHGRPSIPPGRYYRMLFVGYFEGVASQRGIAWRCSDSLSLRDFLGLALDESSPDHSSMTRIRHRLPLEVDYEVFRLVLTLAEEKGLLRGCTVGVDASTLEANAAMKSIVRKDSGEDWREYLRRLAEQEGIENPTDEDLRRFDRKRKNKKVSNAEWESATDRDSRIAKMKDGRTHLAYKAENVVDLDTELVVAAEVYTADQGDPETLPKSLDQAQENIDLVDGETDIEDVAADKGYHKTEMIADVSEERGVRTYIPEREQKGRRRWTDKPASQQKAFYANRRRVRGERSKRLQRRRSEVVERTFAHMCETGGGRRSWLRGLENVRKRWLIQAAARNLGLILRTLFGVGTARSLQGAGRLLCFLHFAILNPWRLMWRVCEAKPDLRALPRPPAAVRYVDFGTVKLEAFSTGC